MPDRSPLFSRRTFLALVAAGVAWQYAGRRQPRRGGKGRLLARPGRAGKLRAAGEHVLIRGPRGESILVVPKVDPGTRVPLLVALHGATGLGRNILGRLAERATAAGFAVLAPTSYDYTWDAIRGVFAVDVAAIDEMLDETFTAVDVDPDRIYTWGFSDGATYAISLALINGDLFAGAIAHSPGFFVEGEVHGKPRLFVSHGTDDEILPIGKTSRRLVPVLRSRGYDMTFREFEGGHTIPLPVLEEALAWAGSRTRLRQGSRTPPDTEGLDSSHAKVRLTTESLFPLKRVTGSLARFSG